MTGILVTNKGSKEEICELPQPLEVSGAGKAHNFKNRSGETFNGIHILYPVERSNDGHIKYLMKCHCGKYFITTAKNIVNGNTKSCGCRKIKSIIDRNHSKTESLIGQTIGYLKILEFLIMRTTLKVREMPYINVYVHIVEQFVIVLVIK